MVLGALVVIAAAATALGTGHSATAAVTKRPDFGSRDETVLECFILGGIFIDTGDGNLWCQRADGSQIVCDSNGNDCYNIPVLSPGVQDPFAGPGNEATTDVGNTGPADPVADSPTSADGQRSLVAPANDRDQDHHTSKNGKKSRHGGKHRRR